MKRIIKYINVYTLGYLTILILNFYIFNINNFKIIRYV